MTILNIHIDRELEIDEINHIYIYNRNNMHVVCKWCRWRYTIHLRVFAVCHTYKISQMSVQSQRASSPIRGTGNILTHENTKGRGIQFHSGYWKKHNEHGDSVCELLKHIFSYRMNKHSNNPEFQMIAQLTEMSPPEVLTPLCFSLVYCSSSKIYGLIPMYLANLHPVLLLDPLTHEFIESTRTELVFFLIIHHWEPILNLDTSPHRPCKA